LCDAEEDQYVEVELQSLSLELGEARNSRGERRLELGFRPTQNRVEERAREEGEAEKWR
jgi:hypothetical protein